MNDNEDGPDAMRDFMDIMNNNKHDPNIETAVKAMAAEHSMTTTQFLRSAIRSGKKQLESLLGAPVEEHSDNITPLFPPKPPSL